MMGSWKNNSKSLMQKLTKKSKSIIWRENITDIVQKNSGKPLLQLLLQNSHSVPPTLWPLLQLRHRKSCTWLLLRNSHTATATPYAFKVSVLAWNHDRAAFSREYIRFWSIIGVIMLYPLSSALPCKDLLISMCVHAHAFIRSCIHSHAVRLAQKQGYTLIQMRKNTWTHAHAQTFARVYTPAQVHTCTETCISTHNEKKMKLLFWNIRLILLLSQNKNIIDEIYYSHSSSVAEF